MRLLPLRGISNAVACVVDERHSCDDEVLIVFGCGELAWIDEIGVSMLMSSLIPEELSLGIMGGGGVRIRSFRLFQKDGPPAFLIACVVNVAEDVRLREPSDICSRLSIGPAVAWAMLGEDAVVVG